MKKWVLIWIGACLYMGAAAQAVFKTLVPNGPVVAGQSFQVQYVLENIDRNHEFYAPEFKSFNRISGPNTYTGTVIAAGGPREVKNIVYTLSVAQPGRIVVPGAAVRVNDHYIKSDDVTIEVISKTDAARRDRNAMDRTANADYFLRAGEDPHRKIRDNLFLKVLVDRKTCFVGEPVTATFKLYSRLISKSDIVKNPGFYGFTVLDVVGLDDKQAGTELFNGKRFDVHTVRKVQLYPLQAGLFKIDPMEVTNQVEFSRTPVDKKAEQEITEGVYPHNDALGPENTESYESTMSSEPIVIVVKPLPEKNRPADYTGATGHFSIRSSVSNTSFAQNEESKLTVIISGKGNFTQIGTPVVHWPDSLEGFEPMITDSLDKSHSPLKGSRVFQFAFVSARAGNYIIPAISFSFFDPDTATYKTVATSPVAITVTNKEKSASQPLAAKEASKTTGYFLTWIAAGLALLAGIALLWLKKRKQQPVRQLPGIAEALPSVVALMQPAQAAIGNTDTIFYTACRQCAWNFFTVYFGITGSHMNNRYLDALLREKNMNEASREELLQLLQECETGIFAGARLQTDQQVMYAQMRACLERIARYA